MAIEIGDYYLVKTKTINNTFGDVVYKVLSASKVPAENPKDPDEDGFIFEMQGGTGPLARKGIQINNSVRDMEECLKKGIAVKIAPDIVEKMTNHGKGGGNSLLPIEMD